MPEQSSEEKPQEPQRPKTRSKVADHLANARTLLAWVRTGLAVIGLGFIISRFGLLLREQVSTTVPRNAPRFSSILGALMSLLGALILIYALFLFYRVQRTIETEQFRPSFLFEAISTGLVALVGIFLFFYLLFVA